MRAQRPRWSSCCSVCSSMVSPPCAVSCDSSGTSWRQTLRRTRHKKTASRQSVRCACGKSCLEWEKITYRYKWLKDQSLRDVCVSRGGSPDLMGVQMSVHRGRTLLSFWAECCCCERRPGAASGRAGWGAWRDNGGTAAGSPGTWDSAASGPTSGTWRRSSSYTSGRSTAWRWVTERRRSAQVSL